MAVKEVVILIGILMTLFIGGFVAIMLLNGAPDEETIDIRTNVICVYSTVPVVFEDVKHVRMTTRSTTLTARDGQVHQFSATVPCYITKKK